MYHTLPFPVPTALMFRYPSYLSFKLPYQNSLIYSALLHTLIIYIILTCVFNLSFQSQGCVDRHLGGTQGRGLLLPPSGTGVSTTRYRAHHA